MSWHWLFFINIVPGIIVTIATWVLVDFDRPDYSLLERFDWWGLLSMAGFLGALEYVLEEGPRNDWFDDNTITLFAIVSALSAIVFFTRVLTAAEPIVDLRAFANRNFALGSLFSFVLGIGLYGLTYLYPVYLAQVRGYNALMIGDTMFISGMAMFISAPIVGQLVQRFDPRYVLMAGFLFFAFGTWQMTWITRDWDFWELLLPQIFRGVGLMFAIVPVTNTALGTLPPERMKNASGLFNLTRNLGGAIGLAAINTVLNDRMDLHLARLHEAVNWGSVTATETLAQLTQKFGGSDGQLMALKQMSLMTRGQATVMSFADVFVMLTVLFVALAAAGIIMKKPAAAGAPAEAGH
jgi:DHA2 family multidrug resistance protein